jgi:integrase
MRRRSIKKYINGFATHLEETGISPSTIKLNIRLVRTFYKHHDIQLPDLHLKKTHNDETFEDVPTKEDIIKVLDYANPKYQAIITLMASSGLGSGEVRSLTVKDFLEALKIPTKRLKNELPDIDEIYDLWDKNTIPVWRVKRIKTQMPYYTLSSLESVNLIFRYLEREPPKGIDEPLFRAAAFGDMGGGFISGAGFAKMFRKLNRAVGFPNKFFTSHKLRKFFITTLIGEDIQQIKVDWMLGHDIKNTTNAYFKSDPDKLLKSYLPVLPLLTFKEKVKVQMLTDKRLQELKAERKRDQKRIDELEEIINADYKWNKSHQQNNRI